MLADVNCYCKMTSVMALECVMYIYARKSLQIHVNICDIV